MTTDVQESIEAAARGVSVSPADRGGTVGTDSVQPALSRLARATSLALAGTAVSTAETSPSDPLITGGSTSGRR